MRSALVCVVFTIITSRPGSRAVGDDDFRPTPIPLWNFEERDARSAALYQPEPPAPATTAALPAHYWEDALRHSVYLTLVRDNIDRLIARGDVISPNTKPDLDSSKEVEDHDLWDRIKSAPFERIEAEEPAPLGDVTVVAKGRLTEEQGRLKFTEDEMSRPKCDGNQTCSDSVRAYWSVKRIRQKDGAASSGKYHYELTFAVMTQTPKKSKKPYEQPTRTFTVKETTPEQVVEQPREHLVHKPVPQVPRRERALWFHKNIYQVPQYQARQHHNGLDRLFTSLFSDDDDDYTVIQRYKPKQTYVPQSYMQFNSKVAYVGASSETHQQQQQQQPQQHQQKKVIPYPYKPHSVKYSRPPLPPPPPPAMSHPHHYLDTDSIGVVSAPYMAPYPELNSNVKYHYTNKQPVKSRYPVMPAPAPYPTKKVNTTYETTTAVEDAVSTTKVPEIVTAYIPEDGDSLWPTDPQPAVAHVSERPQQSTNSKPEEEEKPWPAASNERPPSPQYESEKQHEDPRPWPSVPHGSERPPPQAHSKPKPTTMKVSYFPEHVRPPVYNAPPGIFVTMDKKPFKPMPPLRVHSSKPYKTHKPIDFRPSPQVLDTAQFSEPDQLRDVFRPITINYHNENATTQQIEIQTTTTAKPVPEKPLRKAKPQGHKRHEVKKSQHSAAFLSTSPAPEIITGKTSSEEAHDSIQWANLLGAFAKTTPMAAPSEKVKEEPTTPVVKLTTVKPTTTSAAPLTTGKPVVRRTTTTTEEPIATTTLAPAKRTRPPPKYTKAPKIKKHKRITTTTTKAPEKFTPKRPLHDLTPQASSAAASKTSAKWSPTITPAPATTTKPPTTTTPKPTTTTELVTVAATTAAPTEKPKNKNRYRQSTLMQKGTSVNHDKWSVIGGDFASKTKTSLPSSGSYPPRRKGSNFQGYVTSSTDRTSYYDNEDYNDDDEEIPSSPMTTKISSTTEISSIRAEKLAVVSLLKTTPVPHVETHDNDSETESSENDASEENDSESEEGAEQEIDEDQAEFIFNATSRSPQSDRSNEITDSEETSTTEQIVIASTHSVPKNKTKCKKKLTTTTDAYSYSDNDDAHNDDSHEDNEPAGSSDTKTNIERPSTADIFDELFGAFTFDESQESSSEANNQVSKPESDHAEGESERHERYVQKQDDPGQNFEDFLEELEDANKDVKNEEQLYSEEAGDDDDDEEESLEEDSAENDENEQQARDAIGSDVDDDLKEREDPISLFELMAME